MLQGGVGVMGEHEEELVSPSVAAMYACTSLHSFTCSTKSVFLACHL